MTVPNSSFSSSHSSFNQINNYLNYLREQRLLSSLPGMDQFQQSWTNPDDFRRHLLDYGYDTVNRYLWNVVKEKVNLHMDVSLEDRLFLNNGGEPEMKAILSSNRCEMKLNISPHVGHYDTSPVDISGPPDGVLAAYLATRQLLPITIWFDLHLNANLSSIILDPATQPLQDIQKRHDMSICVVPSQSPVITPTPMNHITVYIRTKRENEGKLQSGIDALREYIETNNFGQFQRVVQTKIDVPSNRHDIIGRSYSQLDPIATKTSTQIVVNKSATNLNHSPNISIAGHDYTSVSAARTEISDRFVVEVDFEINANQSQVLEDCGRELERLGDQFCVHILMRPSDTPNHKVVIIRGTDREVRSLFDVRKHVMDLLKKPPPPSPVANSHFQAINNNNNYL